MIGQKVKILRSQRGFSQEYLAEELGISQSTMARIEAGKSELPASLLPKLCGILQVTLSYFFEGPVGARDHLHCLDQNSQSAHELRTRVAQMKSYLERYIKKLDAISSMLARANENRGSKKSLK